MEHLKNKSEINMKSAELLDKNGLYASVIHCAYYSCFQLMLCIKLKEKQHINSILKKIYEEENKKPKEEKRIGSHETLIIAIYNFLYNKSKISNLFKLEIYKLKVLRNIADYNDKPIDKNLSTNSIVLSKSIQNILKEYI